jgi:hypothetical protein
MSDDPDKHKRKFATSSDTLVHEPPKKKVHVDSIQLHILRSLPREMEPHIMGFLGLDGISKMYNFTKADRHLVETRNTVYKGDFTTISHQVQAHGPWLQQEWASYKTVKKDKKGYKAALEQLKSSDIRRRRRIGLAHEFKNGNNLYFLHRTTDLHLTANRIRPATAADYPRLATDATDDDRARLATQVRNDQTSVQKIRYMTKLERIHLEPVDNNYGIVDWDVDEIKEEEQDEKHLSLEERDYQHSVNAMAKLLRQVIMWMPTSVWMLDLHSYDHKDLRALSRLPSNVRMLRIAMNEGYGTWVVGDEPAIRLPVENSQLRVFIAIADYGTFEHLDFEPREVAFLSLQCIDGLENWKARQTVELHIENWWEEDRWNR